jgi:hypothetical protein
MAVKKIQDLSPEVIAALEQRVARLPQIELKLISARGVGDWRREEIYGDDGR